MATDITNASLSDTTEKFENGIRRNGLVLKNNPFFVRDVSGGYSPCVAGSPTRAGADVLCNCTGFAAGAFNESFMKRTYGNDTTKWPSIKFPYKLKNQANYFLDGIRIQYFRKYNREGFNKNILDYPELFTSLDASTSLTNWGESSVAELYPYIIPASGKPPEGGIIVWDDTHVAYIAEVHNDDKITIIQSGYDYAAWTPSNNAGTGCCNNTKIITRNENGTNHWYYRSNSPCLGFIANPAVADGTVTPDPDTPVVTTKYGTYIGGQFYGAHIYTSSGWKRATPIIWNGSKWVKCKK